MEVAGDVAEEGEEEVDDEVARAAGEDRGGRGREEDRDEDDEDCPSARVSGRVWVSLHRWSGTHCQRCGPWRRMRVCGRGDVRQQTWIQ